jgi:hypothetical protein
MLSTFFLPADPSLDAHQAKVGPFLTQTADPSSPDAARAR